MLYGSWQTPFPTPHSAAPDHQRIDYFLVSFGQRRQAQLCAFCNDSASMQCFLIPCADMFGELQQTCNGTCRIHHSDIQSFLGPTSNTAQMGCSSLYNVFDLKASDQWVISWKKMLDTKGFVVIAGLVGPSIVKAAASAIRAKARATLKMMNIPPGKHFQGMLEADWIHSPPNWKGPPFGGICARGWQKGPGVGRIGGPIPGSSIKSVGGPGAKTITHNTFRFHVFDLVSHATRGQFGCEDFENTQNMVQHKFWDFYQISKQCFGHVHKSYNHCYDKCYEHSNPKTMVLGVLKS
jgi:hypothetical protein